MQKSIFFFFTCFLFSCSSPKNLVSNSENSDKLPACLREIIKTMSEDLSEGIPLSVTQFNYHDQNVYYMIAPCCDKYNIVYDSACTILGYPDGGFTGRGDGKMKDFEKETTDPKVIWESKNERKDSSLKEAELLPD